MKPMVLSLIFTGFATHLTALSLKAESHRPIVRASTPVQANVAILDFEPRRELEDYLGDWLKQIDARVEYAPQGRIYHIPRSFTLRVTSLPRELRAEVIREIRRALGGERRVDGATIDGERVGMFVESGDE